jgi:hypothetical protein
MRPPGNEAALQQALVAAFALDRLSLKRLHEAVAVELGELAQAPSRYDEAAAVEQSALAQMRLAGDHLGLGPDERLTVARYRRAQAELGLMNSIIAAFDGSWTTALVAFERSARWRSWRRGYRNRVGHPRERVPAGAALAEWMAAGSSSLGVDYDRFRERRNAACRPGERLLPAKPTICRALGVTRFSDAVASVDGSARAPVAKRVAVHASSLVGKAAARAILRDAGRDPDLLDQLAPAKLLDCQRGWLREDVVALAKTPTRPRRRTPYWLERDVLSSDQVAELVGLDRNSLRAAEAPPRDGKVGNRQYWLRATVERWLAEQAELVAKRKAGRAGRARRERRAPSELELMLVSATEAHAVLGATLDVPGAPTRVLSLAHESIAFHFYLRADVEAAREGAAVAERRRDYLNELLLTSAAIVSGYGVARREMRTHAGRARLGFPEPAARLGVHCVWWLADVEGWAP